MSQELIRRITKYEAQLSKMKVTDPRWSYTKDCLRYCQKKLSELTKPTLHHAPDSVCESCEG